MTFDFFTLKNVHIVGIGGIGVSAIARFFLSKKCIVSGSDMHPFDDLKDLESRGARIVIGHHTENLAHDVEAVIFSPAVKENNPEIVEAKKRGIPCFGFPEALQYIMERRHGIAISGTNGKTTTTSLLGKIFEKEGWDPLVVVGGYVPGWDKNIRVPLAGSHGTSRDFPFNIFVSEACEYRRHMLNLQPRVIVLTNIEEDHLDYFKDVDDIKNAFVEYVAKLPEKDGILIYNADDTNVSEVADSLEKTKIRKISYSLEKDADASASGMMYALDGQVFRLKWEGINLGVFLIRLPGRFNIYNAVAAATTALALGVQPNSVRQAFEEFSGTWRRFEKLGTVHGKIIISDYAHHPTAVKGTIQATRELYPGKKILAVFQPHQQNRTAEFLNEFAHCFENTDTVVISEIYDVEGRTEPIKRVSSKDLIAEMKKTEKCPPVGYAGSLEETEMRIRELMDPFDIVLIMGAGDIYKVAEKLAGKRKKL